MNRRYNFLRPATLISAASAVMFVVISPVAAATPILTPGTSSGRFCTGLTTKASNITNNINDLEGKVRTAWTNQNTRLTTLASNVDQRVTTARHTADANWQIAFSKLEAKATTDSEKSAVHTYETSVNQAISTRRSAYDTARTTFRNGVKDTITTRLTTLSDQANTYADTANTALNTAETACTNNTGTPSVIHTTLISSLRTARQTFVSERKDDTKVGQTVRQLAATRNAAFKAADEAFKTSLQQANTTLKAAFGSQASSIE
jgi:hypothetical protein